MLLLPWLILRGWRDHPGRISHRDLCLYLLTSIISHGIEAKVGVENIKNSFVGLSNEQVEEEELEEFGSLPGMGTTFKGELEEGKEDEGGH